MTSSKQEPPKKSGKGKSKAVKIIAVIVGILVMGFVCLLGLGILGTGAYFGIKKATEKNGEMVEVPQSSSGYSAWRNAMLTCSKNPSQVFREESAPKSKVGLFTKWFSLPSSGVVKAALRKQLPESVRLLRFEPVAFEKLGDEIAVTYAIQLQFKKSLYTVQVQKFVPESKDSRVKRIAKYLVLSSDLPAGKMYSSSSRELIVPEGKVVNFNWNVQRASKMGGHWEILEADPLIFQKDLRFEAKWFQENASPRLVRTEDDLDLANSKKVAALEELNSKIEQINVQVSEFHSQAMSGVPGTPVDRKGGSGSGTPTKAGMGMLAGAGAGAGLGAAAGGGDGAAIGAGAGAVAGLIGGFMWGRSDEEDELKRKRSARNRARRAAQRRVNAYEKQLWAELEQELARKASEHDSSLRVYTN